MHNAIPYLHTRAPLIAPDRYIPAHKIPLVRPYVRGALFCVLCLIKILNVRSSHVYAARRIRHTRREPGGSGGTGTRAWEHLRVYDPGQRAP